MESSSKDRASPDLPPSGPPPVFSLSPADPQHLHNITTDDIPESEKEGSPWHRKPNPNRRLTQPILTPLPRSEDDVELRGEGLEDPEKNYICGCSRANFIIIVFFLIVLVAAAVGGGVAGSLYASRR